ncbi:MAG: hypothetical protein KBD83_00440 [Gammaproteobacteria bacterium]|nr:hypothetical protein [Gammaproteobacteria bacterium]
MASDQAVTRRMASKKPVTLRWNPALTEEVNPSFKLSKIHEHYSDATRSQFTYNRRKKAHEDDLLTPLARNLKDDDAYQQFCDELNDCYDTDMLLMICNKFSGKIADQVHYKEYLFGKLASWSNQSPQVCNYIINLLSPKQDTNHTQGDATNTTHKNNKKEALKKGQQTLTATLSEREKNFFKQLEAELDAEKKLFLNAPPPRRAPRREATQSKAQTSPHANIPSVTYDDEILDFLARMQRSSGRNFTRHQEDIAQNQQDSSSLIEKSSIRTTAEKIDKAISAIDLFLWDSLNREQKFIQKVISALKKQPGETQITLRAGAHKRTTFTFNRNQILVLIRANPSLCAEFKKALAPKPSLFSLGQTTLATLFNADADAHSLFADNNDNFLTSAKILLPNLFVAENKPSPDIQQPPPRQASNNPADTNRLTVATTTEVVSGSLSIQPTAASLEAPSILSPLTDLSEHATNSSAPLYLPLPSSLLLIANHPFNADKSVVDNSQQENTASVVDHEPEEETANQDSALDDQPTTQSVALLNTPSEALVSASQHRPKTLDIAGVITSNLKALTVFSALQTLTNQFTRSLPRVFSSFKLNDFRFRTAPLCSTLKLENDPALALENSSQSVAADPGSQLITDAVTSAKNFGIDEDGLTVTTTTEAVNEITIPIVSQANNPEVDKPPYPLLIANFPFNVDESVVANSQQEETANQDSQLDDQPATQSDARLNTPSEALVSFRTAPLDHTLKLENDPTLVENSSQSVAADPESQSITGSAPLTAVAAAVLDAPLNIQATMDSFNNTSNEKGYDDRSESTSHHDETFDDAFVDAANLDESDDEDESSSQQGYDELYEAADLDESDDEDESSSQQGYDELYDAADLDKSDDDSPKKPSLSSLRFYPPAKEKISQDENEGSAHLQNLGITANMC